MDYALKQKWIEMAVREVSTQCKLAAGAFSAIPTAQSVDISFILIQAFLSHTANASKMLQAHQEPFPVSRYESEWRKVFNWLRRAGLFHRGPTIGDLLNVGKGTSIHHQGRAFRNNLEHYDARLFSWLRKHGPQVSIADFNVMPKNAVQIPGLIWIRNLDPVAFTFTFVDKDLNLATIRTELDEIRNIADAWLATKASEKTVANKSAVG